MTLINTLTGEINTGVLSSLPELALRIQDYHEQGHLSISEREHLAMEMLFHLMDISDRGQARIDSKLNN